MLKYEPKIDTGENERLLWASAVVQGHRNSNRSFSSDILDLEDFHIALTSLPNYPAFAFFGVYDGHMGGKVAKICQERMHMKITENEVFNDKDYNQAIISAFYAIDNEVEKGILNTLTFR